MPKRFWLVLIGLGVFVSWGGGQGPCTVTVPPGSSIQAAIDSARPGAVVCLPPGTWRENLVVGKPLTLRGAGPDQTRVLAREAGLPVIRVSSSQAVEVRIEGLTAGEGRFAEPYENHGILVGGRVRLLLTDCAVEGNEWHGVLVEEEAQVSLLRCRLGRNRVHGLAVEGTAGAELTECTIEGNGAHGVGVLSSGSVTLRASAVRGNGSHGMALGGTSSVEVRGCTVEENAWSGISVGGSVQVVLEGNVIRGNGEHGVALQEAPCAAGEAVFSGRVSGRGNTIPPPGSPGGNGLGALCPPELQFLRTGAGGALDRRK